MRLFNLAVFLRLTIALATATLLLQFPFYSLESWTFDLRVRLVPDFSFLSSWVSENYFRTENQNQIVLVKLDAESVKSLGHEPGASELTTLFEKVATDNPLGMAYTMWPFKAAGTYFELDRLAHTLSGYKNFYLFTESIPVQPDDSSLHLPTPFQALNVVVAPVSRDLRSFAADDVSRRALIGETQGLVYGHTLLANLVTKKPFTESFRGEFEYRKNRQVLIHFQRVGSFQSISYNDVIGGLFPRNFFKDKIVLFGRDAQTDTADYTRTPYSSDPLSMSKLEVHANIIQTLISDNGLVRPPEWVTTLLTVLVCLLTSLVVFSLKPTFGLLAATGLLLLIAVSGFLFFWWGGIIIPMAHPLLSLLIPYYLFLPYRLIQEYRKRWEFQEKHTLISQVEELKTNFLSMMSHDLKTPLARIQGMAEIAEKEIELNDQASLKKSIHSILKSTEELTKFVTSILNLSRIESKDVKLQKQSKDLNSLLTEVIDSLRPLALEKNIQILTEFEPLFSVKVDVDLLRQAFLNLIENAIKYSPVNSRVLVSTEEVQGLIVIQVADQGDGIFQHDMERIFMKFYRSPNAKSSAIKGSGLGLYLAKYFVQLHDGQITVESQPNEGSTFTVELPSEDPKPAGINPRVKRKLFSDRSQTSKEIWQ